MSKRKRSPGPGKLTALGFCGVDDSVDPQLLGLISDSYPFVEFGVLFRPDKEGTPRYASQEWVEKLKRVARKVNCFHGCCPKMHLAAHLCGSRVDQILKQGDASFLESLRGVFGRCQINATAINGVDTSDLAGGVSRLLKVVQQFPDMEFIIQKNEETTPVWEGLLSSSGCFPSNVTFLLDESKGTGLYAGGWSGATPEGYSQSKIGFAGGIGPSNVAEVLSGLIQHSDAFWIDMESSLRSTKNEVDVFDIDKCFQCIQAVIGMNLYEHPEFLSIT